MKKILFLLIGLTIISCKETDNSSFQLNGNAIGFADGTNIYVYKVGNNNQPSITDTLIVNGEKFNGTFSKTEELTINYLQAEKVKGNVLFFPENSNLSVTIYKDSIASSFVTGSPQNDSYRKYYTKMNDFSDQRRINSELFKQARRDKNTQLANKLQENNNDIVDQENAYKILFVSENSNSLFSVLLVSEMLNRKEISSADAAKLIKNFSPKVAVSPIAKKLNTSILSAKKADVGGVAPNFSAPTPEGEILALNDILGKYTIIDFWASWCKPCRRENPNVVRVYKQYHDKGLNIISVSLDKAGQKARWIKAIEDDNMNWHHISNLKGWNEPIAKMYSVRSIPATFLLDEKGNIIAKNLRGNALDAKIASLLGD